MIYIIHEMLVSLKNHLNYLKDLISCVLFKGASETFIMMEGLSLKEENITKDKRNLFRLKSKLK